MLSRKTVQLIAVGLVGLASFAAGQSARPGYGAIPYSGPGGTGTTFRVWAPFASSVGVKGQFNGWATTPLVRETNGYWSADVAGARPGHEYKYRINNSFDKRDPRARRVVNSAGNSIIYDTNSFVWTSGPFTKPAVKDTVIYEMHVGTFNVVNSIPATFDQAIQRLDHLVQLGVTAVQVMPICEFPGDRSWGYNPADLFSVESALGGVDAFKRFVDACHQRGLAVLVDVVHNHYGPTDLDLWQFDGWHQNNLGGIYFYNDPARASTWWGNTRPNFGSNEVRRFIRDQIFMWLEECRVDGFRWDSVFNIVYYNNGANHNPEGESLLRAINAEVQQSFPGTLRIAEDHAFDFNMNFDAQWHVGFHDELKYVVTRYSDADRSMFSVASLYNGWPSHNRVIFSESHDTVGDLNSKVRLPRDIDPGNPESIWARKRALLAAAVVMTAPGIPMIFQGQEMHETWTFSDGTGLRWNLTNTYAGIVRAYRDLIRLRRNLGGGTGGLRGTGVNVHHLDNVNKVIAVTRWDSGGGVDDVVVVANFSVQTWNANNYVVPFPSAGTWYSHFNSDSTNIQPDFGNIGPAFVVATGSPPRAPVNMGMYSLQIFSKREPVTPGRVTFIPPSVTGCVSVVIRYEPLEHPLRTATQVFAYIGRNDWQDIGQWPMSNVQAGVWEHTHNIQPGTYRLDMAFHNGAGTWDNNLQADWHLSVVGCATGVPPEVTWSPSYPEGCARLTIQYRANEGPLAQATNVFLYAGRNGWFDITTTPMTLISAKTWRVEYALPPGTRRLNFAFHDGAGTWDNRYGANWSVPVEYCWPAPPGLTITNPVGTTAVEPEVTQVTIRGTATVSVAGWLRWTNQFNGASGAATATTRWSIASIPVGVGTNVIRVRGTNQPTDASAYDAASNATYSAGWTNGSGGGAGWAGGWLFSSSGNAGHFRAVYPSSTNLNLATIAWGLWANSGGLSEARRPFNGSLAAGDIFRIGFENNWIQTGGSVGFSLHNDEGRSVFDFYFLGGESTYRVTDALGDRPTPFSWTEQGFFAEFQLIRTTQYVLRVGTSAITGSVSAALGLTQVRLWNYSAGPGTPYNLYVTSMQIVSTNPPPSGALAEDTVTVVRPPLSDQQDADNDGLPDSWEQRYFGSPTAADPNADPDADGRTNWEEFVADTNPTNATSFYPARILSAAASGNVLSLVIPAPTTNSRIYDILWATNLLQPTWTRHRIDLRGDSGGSALVFTVTNHREKIFYRSLVTLP